jgi:hypothetical protein
MPSIIRAARRRARDYWQIDGLPRIIDGLSTLIIGVLFLFMRRSGPWLALLGCIAYGVKFLFELQGGQENLVNWLKAKVTYPRSGYVDSLGETRPWETGDIPLAHKSVSKMPPQNRSWMRRIAGIGLIMLFGAFLFCWGAVFFVGTPLICITAGTLTAALAVTVNRWRNSLPWLSAVGWILIGFALANWGFARHQKILFLFLASGALSLLTGSIAFLLYMWRNPLLRAQ